MAVFGPYETVEELPSRPWVLVATARTVGEETRPRLVLKTTRGLVGFDSAEAADQRRQDLVAAATVQNQVGSEQKSRRWARVREITESYFVLDRYDRSAADLARQRRLTTGELRSVTRAVLEALQEIHGECGRGHGRLHAANVLIRQVKDSALGEIVLTDPAAEAPASGERDFQDLGYLVRHLATGVEDRAGEPPESSWRSLGRAAGFWKDLAKELIEVDPTGELPGISDLLQRIKRGAPKESSRRGPLLAACVFVAAVVTGVGGWLMLAPDGERLPTDEEVALLWVTVCTEIDGWCRVRDPDSSPTLKRALNDAWASRGTADPELDEHVRSRTGEVIAYWDAVVAEVPQDGGIYRWNDLRLAQRDRLKVVEEERRRPWAFLKDAEFKRAVESLHTSVVEMRDALSGNGASSVWGLRARMSRLESGFEEDGWTGAASLVGSTLGLLDPATYLKPESEEYAADATEALAAAIVNAAVLEYHLGGLSTEWGEGVEAAAAIQDADRSRDPVLLGVASVLPQAGESDSEWNLEYAFDLGAQVRRALPELRAARQFVDGDEWDRVDTDLLAAASLAQFPAGDPTVETLGGWVELARGHVKLDEPDPILAQRAALSEQKVALDEAVGVGDQGGDPGIRGVREDIASLSTALDQEYAWIRQDRQAVLAVSADYEVKLESIRERVADYQVPATELIDTLLSAEVPYQDDGAEPLQSYWRASRDAWVAGLGNETYKSYPVIVSRRQLDISLAAISAGLPATVLANVPSVFDGDAILLAAGEKRKDVLAEVLRVVSADWGVGDYKLSDADQQALAASRLSWGSWLARAKVSVRELGDTYQRLIAFEPLVGVNGDGISPRQVWEKWTTESSGVIGDLGGVAHFSALDDLVASLETVGAEERGALIGWIGDTSASDQARYAAWRKLGSASPVWPLTPNELQLAAAYVGERRASFAGEGVSESLRAELERESSRRWGLVMADAMRSGVDVDIESAFGLMVSYGIDIAAQPVGVRLNHATYALKQRVLLGDDDAAVTGLEIWRQSVASWTHPAIGGLSSEFDAKVAESEGGTDIARLTAAGPGLHGWTGEIAASPTGDGVEGDALAFTSPGGLWLNFVLVDDSNERLVYLSTAEVSIAVASWAVGAVGDLPGLAEEWSSLQSDQWRGARAWELDGNRLVAFGDPNRWYAWDTADASSPKFESNQRLVGTTDQNQLPLQNVSFDAATALAEALGCRLPTPAEWLGAIEVSGADPGGANLRDSSFGRQRDFVAQAHLGTSKLPYPDDLLFPWLANAPQGAAAVNGAGGDGVLFFDAVGGRGGFAHLFGNVAEFVSEDGRPAVIGGSALSHPGTPAELATAYTGTGRASLLAARPYSDVGFRLALQIEGTLKPSLANELTKWFGETRYVRANE